MKKRCTEEEIMRTLKRIKVAWESMPGLSLKMSDSRPTVPGRRKRDEEISLVRGAPSTVTMQIEPRPGHPLT